MIFSATFQLFSTCSSTTPLTPRLTTTGCKVVAVANDRYASLM